MSQGVGGRRVIVAGTGHRIVKQPPAWPPTPASLVDFLVSYLQQLQPSHVISGMALGFDQGLALAAIRCSIPFTAAVPFKGQEHKWPASVKTRYAALLREAQHVEYVSEPGYEPWKMHARNAWMVDRCDRLVALYDGSGGGTKSCLDYASSKGVKIEMIWPAWCDYVQLIAKTY